MEVPLGLSGLQREANSSSKLSLELLFPGVWVLILDFSMLKCLVPQRVRLFGLLMLSTLSRSAAIACILQFPHWRLRLSHSGSSPSHSATMQTFTTSAVCV